MENISRQLQYYRSMNPEQLEHRKQVAKAWREKQDPEILKAKQKDWLRRRLAADPNYLRNKRLRLISQKKSSDNSNGGERTSSESIRAAET